MATNIIDRIETDAMSVIGTSPALDAIRKRAEDRAQQARDRVEGFTGWDPLRALKGKMIARAEPWRKARRKLDEQNAAGELTPHGYESQRVHLRERLTEAVDEVLGEFEDKAGSLVMTPFPRPSSPPPVADADLQRLEILLRKVRELQPTDLRDEVIRLAEVNQLPLLAEIRPFVENRAAEYVHQHVGEPNPMEEALEAIDLSLRTANHVAHDLAHERVESMTHQLGTVARVIRDRGSWSGPASTMEPRTTPDFPPVGEAETLIHGKAEGAA